MKQIKIPKSVYVVSTRLEDAGFDAFVVGGCVRDILLEKTPKDWDITTNATPKQMLEVFPDGKYENDFGTVLVSDKYLTGQDLLSERVNLSVEKLEKLIEIAKEKYLKKVSCGAHGISHAQKVAEKALLIANEYKRLDKGLVELLAFFHDTGRAVVGKDGHIIKGQRIFEGELSDLQVSKADIKALKEALNHHSDLSKKTLEAQILMEADLIDGVSSERISFLKGVARKEHINWLKSYFNKEGAFSKILTSKGRELMFKAIASFNKENKELKIPQIDKKENENIEITTYRIESKYSDRRHPDQVRFAKTLKEDLSRRDFTVNAMAIRLDFSAFKKSKESFLFEKYEVIDLFEGQKDLENGIIKAVGDPNERFDEDALRMLRAIRFAVYLGFEVEGGTKKAILDKIENTSFVSIERIRDEFEKIILSDNPAKGVDLLVETGLMKYIIPEILETIGVRQNHHHYHGPYNTVYKHLVASLAKCPSKKLEVRLAAFLHDIGKPLVKQGSGEKATFYNHEYASAKITKRVLKRLKFPRSVIDKTELLVRNHMFYYNVDEVGESGVRRVVKKVGVDNINDLIDVRVGDRLGSGVPKAVPYKLRHFQYMVEKVSKDPISVKQLKVDGSDLMKQLEIKPGPQIGAILELLLVEAIEDPKINKKDSLLNLAKKLKDKDLVALRKIAKDKISKKNKEEDKKTKQKHWVK